MRRLRLIVAIVLTLAATLVISPDRASAAPTAPFNALTLDGRWNFAFDPSNATFSFTAFTSPNDGVILGVTSGSHNFTAVVAAPTGQLLSVGVFPTLRGPDATHAGLDVFGDGSGCNTVSGSINVRQVTHDASNTITSIAVSFMQIDCNAVAGELRWQSNVDYTAGLANPLGIDAGTVDLGTSKPIGPVQIMSTGSSALHLGTPSITGTNPGAFSITSTDCTNATLTFGQSCTVSLTAHPTAQGSQTATLSIPDDTFAGHRLVSLSVTGQAGAIGTYYPLAPQRILDTRSGIGAPAGKVGQQGVVHLQVGGRGGVPASGVSAVVLNVTATAPTAGSFLTVYPTGVTRPNASNLNFPAGATVANNVIVPVGAGGQVDIFNNVGAVHVIADVMGFYAGSDEVLPTLGVGGQYFPTNPTRLLDTRVDFNAPLPSGFFVTIPVDFDTPGGPAVNAHIRAFIVNVTAVDPSNFGFLTAWNGVDALPNTSTLNFNPHTVVPNLAIVPTAVCTADPSCAGMPSIGVYNGSAGATHVIVDLFGVSDDGSLQGGLRYRPIAPTRIVDSRIGQGVPGAIGQQVTATVSAPGTVAGPNTGALALNVTAVLPTNSTFLTVWPTGLSRPLVSNLNPSTGQIVPNGVITEIGSTNAFNIFNNAGTVNVVVDVSGAYDFIPIPTTSSTTSARRTTLRPVPNHKILRSGQASTADQRQFN